ncbi:hypothetical protein MKW98_023172 [Papaver atlanticum]|uniref:Uncharacterized protein n=1 Tax=Papaver atlanticum TaxID=357466 RepID=A0AAD4XH79_9MAGN|nr:hypothetical protein MKW98_023172 [Papaver atlanticum]
MLLNQQSPYKQALALEGIKNQTTNHQYFTSFPAFPKLFKRVLVYKAFPKLSHFYYLLSHIFQQQFQSWKRF